MEMYHKRLFAGQREYGGDHYKIVKIYTDEREARKVLEYARANISPDRCPDYDTWYRNIAPGGKYFGDTKYFYNGWCKLEKVPHGWKYTLCKPYRDRGGKDYGN